MGGAQTVIRRSSAYAVCGEEQTFSCQANKIMLLLRIIQLSLLAVVVQGNATGAPLAACADVHPTGHTGSSQDLQTNPYSLNLTSFDELGGTLYYLPDRTYESEFS